MSLSEELLDELEEELYSLLFRHSPCNYSSDYECAFCNRRANTNLGDISHSKDCLGKRLQTALQGRNDD